MLKSDIPTLADLLSWCLAPGRLAPVTPPPVPLAIRSLAFCLLAVPGASGLFACRSAAPPPVTTTALRPATESRPAETAPPDWTRTLAVRPGSSLPAEPPPLAQIATLFTLTDTRMAGGQYFVAGTGYVEIDGGGTFFSGPNRKQDPYLEVTIIAVAGQTFEQCRDLLVQPSFEQNAVPDYRRGEVPVDAGNRREETGNRSNGLTVGMQARAEKIGHGTHG